jgi:L-threonylcarbamoyladenylate synthase
MVNFEKDIEACLSVLKSGGLILYPTDTVWGIGCDATNDKAVEKLFRLKQRPCDKAMIVLVADEREVLQYVAAPDLSVFDYLETVHEPTTVIYDHAIGLAENLTGGEDGSIGIRICNEPFCRHLIKRFRKPIVSTSANLHGEITPANFFHISAAIKNEVDYIVSYRQDDVTVAVPSTVIKWIDGRVEVVRGR